MWINEIQDAKMEYDGAVARGSGVNVSKERQKNILFNYCGELVNALKENDSLIEENVRLTEDKDKLQEEVDRQNDGIGQARNKK